MSKADGRRLLTRCLLLLLAVASSAATWPGALQSHCDTHSQGAGMMSQHGSNGHPGSSRPSVRVVQSSHEACAHCPPSECASTAPCTNAGVIGIPVRAHAWSVTAGATVRIARRYLATPSADLQGLTPPPQRIL